MQDSDSSTFSESWDKFIDEMESEDSSLVTKIKLDTENPYIDLHILSNIMKGNVEIIE